MIKLSDKNKDKLIGGLIGVLILILSLFVKSFFFDNKNEKTNTNINKSDLQNVSPIINNTIGDSSVQTINQVQQINKGSGKIQNEFVSGDKKVYNNKVTNNIKNDTNTILNEGFVNNGGIGNIYNQTTIKNEIPQRHLQKLDMEYMLKLISSKKIIYDIWCYNGDLESQRFGIEISNFLKQKDAKQYHVGFNSIYSSFPIEKAGTVEIETSVDTTFLKITIYPIK